MTPFLGYCMFYLYIKTHNVTGLKYLGFTSSDPYKYQGSGTYWKAHIAKHGYNVSTEILLETTNKQDIIDQGLYYSELYEIVQSDNWANLKPEAGDGSYGLRHSEKTKQLLRQISTGRPKSPETLEKLRNSHLGKKFSPEHRKRLSEVRKGKPAHNKGKPGKQGVIFSEERRSNISKALKGRKLSPEHCANISSARKGIPAHNKGKPSKLLGVPKTEEHRKKIKDAIQGRSSITCPHCGKHGGFAGMKRWHFDHCKYKSFGE